MMILSILATVVLLGALFYHRVSLFISSLILLAWTAALGVAGLWSAWVLVPLAIILVPFNLTPMRKSMISAPVFRGFRKVMPPMSRTEKEAIDAGTTWWEGDLFQGKPDWKKLHNYPQPRLTAEEQAFLDGPVEEACRMANDFQITHELADLPPELWAYLKEHRFLRDDHQKRVRRAGVLSLCPVSRAAKTFRRERNPGDYRLACRTH
ncbi:acyl-CoA dehydrogenase [Escherichia coli]|uniref:Acyl-CoA dehydrogenase n=1 Tax=Escherichia coli TaxID=562 RepID=A0A376VN41_ECOLX|nr:acyl-CoA dehydrogenase [Escherichia coli]